MPLWWVVGGGWWLVGDGGWVALDGGRRAMGGAWHATKEARPQPMKRRMAMKPAALVTNMMPRMKGQVRKRQKARPLRAPITSQMVPMTRRAKMVPATEVMLPR